MAKTPTVITKLELIQAPRGHGVGNGCIYNFRNGAHRNWKKQPKGGRNAERRRAINGD